MTNFIPIFPLSVVVYPGEQLNLHIFEPRYIQLVNECYTEKRLFGIPPVIDSHMQDYGTLVRITEISKIHENGEMDIKTVGDQVFRVLEVIKEIPEKLYSGAIVNYPPNQEHTSQDMMRRVIKSIRELHKLLKVKKDFHKKDEELKSYDLAHHIGLSIQEEYELLGLMQERQRLEYIRRHLTKVIPLVSEMEGLKKKVKQNGHFKNLSSFDFEI
jgi:Lon protease-like protein